MTVFENVAFGLKVRHRPKAEIRARVHELLDLVQLEGTQVPRRLGAASQTGQVAIFKRRRASNVTRRRRLDMRRPLPAH